MKKTVIKMLSSSILISIFMIVSTPQAKAWRLFGKETVYGVAVNELACGKGCVGRAYTTTTYFLGVAVSSREGIECICK